MARKATFNEISRMLRNDPENFASRLLGEEPTSRGGTWVRYYPNGSLSVNTSGPAQGKFKLFTDDSVKGDMIDLIRWHHGLPDDTDGRREALDIAKHHLGISDGKIDPAKVPPKKSDEEKKREQEEDIARRVRVANWIWDSSSATEGRAEGLAYLKGRGITVEPPEHVLRFRVVNPQQLREMGIEDAEIPKAPVVALVFAARNTAGEIRAVQQILTSEGRKLPCKLPKRTNGYMPGACVVLGDIDGATELQMAEGPETALSTFEATGAPTYITLGSSNFTKVRIPATVKRLITVSDMEKTGVGLASALKTAQYWQQHGIEQSGIALPPKLNDGDYNDVHQQYGIDVVRSGLEKAFFPPQREQDGTILVTPDARAAFYAWAKTGIEVVAKVPPRKDGHFMPMTLDGLVGEQHNRVLLVQTPGIEIKDEYLRRHRPSLEIVTLHEDSREFRKLFATPGGIQNALNAADIYAPAGMGTKEPVFFALRRADADALKLPDHMTIAIRASALDRVSLDFMKGRTAIVAPLGNGTEHDRKLSDRLESSGADTVRLTWQIFRGDQTPAKILRREIPEGFGAANAASEGWKDDALRDLIDISRANHRQILKAMEPKSKPRKKKEETQQH